MIQNLLFMNGYGLFVWASFSITFISCAVVFYKTKKNTKKVRKGICKRN